MYLPTKSPTINGSVVTTMPAKNNPNPLLFNPATNPGPALIPTTAMKAFNPTLLNTHNAGAGILPNVRFTARSHPQPSPASNAPHLCSGSAALRPREL